MKKFKLALILTSLLFLQADFAKAQGGPPWAGQGKQPGSMGTVMCPKMMQKLGPADANYDLRYMDMMIRHHQMAVMMSKDAMQKARHPELKQMAQNIVNTQTQEIQQMETWRKQWYGK